MFPGAVRWMTTPSPHLTCSSSPCEAGTSSRDIPTPRQVRDRPAPQDAEMPQSPGPIPGVRRLNPTWPEPYSADPCIRLEQMIASASCQTMPNRTLSRSRPARIRRVILVQFYGAPLLRRSVLDEPRYVFGHGPAGVPPLPQ